MCARVGLSRWHLRAYGQLGMHKRARSAGFEFCHASQSASKGHVFLSRWGWFRTGSIPSGQRARAAQNRRPRPPYPRGHVDIKHRMALEGDMQSSLRRTDRSEWDSATRRLARRKPARLELLGRELRGRSAPYTDKGQPGSTLASSTMCCLDAPVPERNDLVTNICFFSKGNISLLGGWGEGPAPLLRSCTRAKLSLKLPEAG